MKYHFGVAEGKAKVFTERGKKAVQIYKDSGEYLVNADLIAADGTRYDSVLVIDTWSSGEHCGTFILLSDGIARQGDAGFLERLGKTEEQFFPYKYKYRTTLPCDDIHIGPNGWSG